MPSIPSIPSIPSTPSCGQLGWLHLPRDTTPGHRPRGRRHDNPPCLRHLPPDWSTLRHSWCCDWLAGQRVRCDWTVVPPGACAYGRACHPDGSGARGGGTGRVLWARDCEQDRDSTTGASRTGAAGAQADRTKKCVFMCPGDGADVGALEHCGTGLLSPTQTVPPRQGQRLRTAASSGRNRREYLKRSHSACDLTKPQTNANTSTWSQSKTTTKQTFGGGFLQVCVATGLERGFD